ncbi:hypothetical protein [Diplocloster hominis]|uniref:hypothetical protein n=1 Tax=Diplocloster hominis TaxID=3079010 RepID=UPI0031BAAE86
MTRVDLAEVLYQSLRALGGQSDIIGVCKYVWEHYQDELRNSGDLFYTWQYDIRWAATELRKANRMKDARLCQKGIWEL